jgi:hypothetical protein
MIDLLLLLLLTIMMMNAAAAVAAARHYNDNSNSITTTFLRGWFLRKSSITDSSPRRPETPSRLKLHKNVTF